MPEPLKAVLDTNVTLSMAFAKEGLAKELREMVAEGAFQLVTSKEILSELYRVIHYPRIQKQFRASKENIDEFMGLMIEQATLTQGSYSIQKIKEDPTDDMFLTCALEAQADYIVSRDAHLRNLKQFQGIKIIDVKSFVEKARKEK